MKMNLKPCLASVATALMIAAAPLEAQAPGWHDMNAVPRVKGAPYSGEAITTVKMKLFDGTQIERSVTARFYRDSDGRVRHDQTVMGLETLDPSNDVRAIVTIVDPVGNVIYSLIAGTKTAERISMDLIQKHVEPAPAETHPQEQQIGTRDIDGIKTTGYRLTTVIPKGQAGNDRPITITDERWESAEMKLLIESRHHDPRTGDVEYRLTKISRKEPPAELFKVPAGYKIVDIPPKGPAARR